MVLLLNNLRLKSKISDILLRTTQSWNKLYRSVAVYYAEIKHFNWLKLVTWLATANQRANKHAKVRSQPKQSKVCI